jgi:hypothetical protein
MNKNTIIEGAVVKIIQEGLYDLQEKLYLTHEGEVALLVKSGVAEDAARLLVGQAVANNAEEIAAKHEVFQTGRIIEQVAAMRAEEVMKEVGITWTEQ